MPMTFNIWTENLWTSFKMSPFVFHRHECGGVNGKIQTKSHVRGSSASKSLWLADYTQYNNNRSNNNNNNNTCLFDTIIPVYICSTEPVWMSQTSGNRWTNYRVNNLPTLTKLLWLQMNLN